MAVSVTVHGLDSAQRRVKHLGDPDQIENTLEAQGDQAAADVTGIPIDTGRLAASIEARMTPDGFDIVSDVPYARHVFEGTRYMPARPPRVAAARIAAQTADALADDLADEPL